MLLLLLGAGAAHGAAAPAAPLPEITTLKPLYPETYLARDGAPAALVLWGDTAELATLGRETAATLSRKTGATIEALPANDLVSQWWEINFDRIAGRNIIAIGNINHHRLLAALWGEGYTDEDSMYPGLGGYVVRTVHDPFGRRFNVIVLAGSDLAGTRRAVEAFLARHLVTQGRSTLLPQPVVEVVLGQPPSPYVARAGRTPPKLPAREKSRSATEFAADLEKMVAQDRSRTTDPAKRVRTLVNVTGTLATLAEAWFKTGDPGLPPLMKQLVDRHRDLLRIAPERVEMEGASGSHAIWWDLVEELPVWTDQDRLDLANAFLRDARQGFESGAAYEKVKEGYVQVVEENHATFSAINILNAWWYFDKYYRLPDTAYWMSVVRATFAGQLASHQPLEDSAGYMQFTPSTNLEYAFKTRDLRYIRLGIARTHLDFMMQAAHNNLGFLTGFGDAPGLLPHGHALYAQLAWFLRDPQVSWWVRDHLPNDCGVATYGAGVPWDVDLPVAPPADWSGVKVFPLYRQALGFTRASKTFVTTPAESAGSEWFNKLAFREGPGRDQQYLLLDGAAVWASTPGVEHYPPGPMGHNHRDLNTIINFTDRGRLWLVDQTYEARGIADHNGLVITRDGLLDYVPHQVRLRDLAQSDRLGLVRTHFEDYSGADWERSIFWLRGDYFVVLDRVIAREAGDFAVRGNLRGLGKEHLDAGGLWLEQQGKWCRIIPDAAAQTEVVPVPFTDVPRWKPYAFAEPVAKSLLQFKSARLVPGETLSFVSVVAAGDSREELARLRLQSDAGKSVRVNTGNADAFYGVGPPPGVAGEVAAYAITGRDALLAGTARLGPADAPVLRARPAVNLAGDGERVWIDAAAPTQLEFPQEAGGSRQQQVPAGRHELTAGSLRTFVQTLAGHASRATESATTAASAASPSPTAGLPALSTTSQRFGSEAQRLLVTDLDGDGTDEWLIAGAAGLTVRRATGETLWTFATPKACRALAAADLDGDGRREIALGCDDEHLYLLGADGRERWRFQCKPSSRALPPTVDQVQIADLDRDGTPEIIVVGNWIHCLSADGKVKWENYQKYARNTYTGDAEAFFVGDVDGDGRDNVMALFLAGYSVAAGFDEQGRRTFPSTAPQMTHGGFVISPPQDIALADLMGDGGRLELVVAAQNELTIRQTDIAHEKKPDLSEAGNFHSLTAWQPAGQLATVYAATDMGAVFAFQAARDSKDSAMKIGRRWVRSVGAKIETLAVTQAGSPGAALWAGTADGAVLQLDPATGAPRAASKPTGSPVLQFIEAREGLHALHADGVVETIKLP